MKLLLVAVPDDQELPAIEGTLVALSTQTSARPAPVEITAKTKELADAVAWLLCRAAGR